MPKPDPPFDYDRRRAEDVFRALESEVFPRLGAIDTKVEYLEHGVKKLMLEGCAQRAGDIRRTEMVEESMGRIFEKIDDFGKVLSDHRVDVTEQIGGIRSWVLGGVVVVLLGLLIYFAKDYAHDIEQHVGKQPASVITPKQGGAKGAHDAPLSCVPMPYRVIVCFYKTE